MPVRVMLLLLMTAFLVAIWNGDQPRPMAEPNGEPSVESANHHSRASSKRSQKRLQKTEQLKTVEQKTVKTVELLDAPVTIIAVRKPTSAEKIVTPPATPLQINRTTTASQATSENRSHSEIFVPNNLPPGRFRVVNSLGETSYITIVGVKPHAQFSGTNRPDKNDSSQAAPPNHLYVTEANGLRWYFIRIQSLTTSPPVTAELVRLPPQPILPQTVASSPVISSPIVARKPAMQFAPVNQPVVAMKPMSVTKAMIAMKPRSAAHPATPQTKIATQPKTDQQPIRR